MSPLKICLPSSEVFPFAKTGGLADVSAALARFLGSKGQDHDVRIFMPMYGRVRSGEWKFEPHPVLQDIELKLGQRSFHFSVSTTKLPDSEVEVYFIRCPELYGRDGLYTSDADEPLRFAFLCRATLEACQWMQWAPDVVHCNDWHTALIPLYLKTLYAWDKLFRQTKTVLTIHNIGYQGQFSTDTLEDLGFDNYRSLLYQEDLQAGHVNFLKTGILYADALTTVSETYAREIQTPEFGMGLERLLAARNDTLFGIVNGVDYGTWSPEQDELIPHAFSVDDLAGKRLDKQALMERTGLDFDPDVPVFGIVSRLTYQKGFELLPEVLSVLLQRENVRLVVLGSGEEKYENYFSWLKQTFPSKVAYDKGYNDPLAHLIEAGADLFLMPSRYEPCGLNQMYSLKYGTVPIVRKTGGLADTVVPYDPAADGGRGAGTGFVFEEFTADALYAAVRSALEVWRDQAAWARLQVSGMRADFSWERQGQYYLRLYELLKD